MDKFQWSPDLGAEREEAPLVKVTKFGDGYESRLPVGINDQPSKWSVSFTSPLLRHKEIRNFLKKQGASKAFAWVDPEGEEGIYVCRSWKSRQKNFGVFEITGAFEQVFERGS